MRVEHDALLDLLPDVVIAMEPDGTVAYSNATVERILGWPVDEVVGRNGFEFVRPDERDEAIARIAEQLAEGDSTRRHHVQLVRRDGGFTKFELIAATSTESAGLLTVVLRDISERAEAQKRLHRSDEQLRALADNVPDALGRFDTSGNLVFATRRFRELVEVDGELSDLWQRHADTVMSTGDLVELEHRIGADGPWVAARFVPETDAAGDVTHVLTIATDVTERKEAELRLLRAATHDALTGLVNRHHFRELAERALARPAQLDIDTAERGTADTHVALVFIDLDGFKEVNDLHGHVTGDAVLAAVGRRLADVVRPQDVVARFGGDEFVMLCDGITRDDARAVADRIAQVLAEPIPVGDSGLSFAVSASIGVAAAGPGATDLDQLLEEADVAMYRAKAGDDRPPVAR